jgi:TonB family protein
MAFRALLFSKNPETNSAMTTACESSGIRVEICSDIFSAIEKAKTRGFSCIIADWSEQPEASFLLKRARESTPNRNTVAIVITDNEPTAAEMRDNRLDSLIYRPISAEEAGAVLSKACENMPPLSAHDAAETAGEARANTEAASAGSAGGESGEHGHQEESEVAEASAGDGGGESDGTTYEDGTEDKSHGHSNGVGVRGAIAAVLVLTAVFCFWRSREVFKYLSQTPEGTVRVLRESVAALFFMNQGPALPAGSDTQQDAYFSRSPGGANTQSPTLGVVATESGLPEAREPLPRAADFPLPTAVFEHQDPPPVHVQRAAIPESMRNSPPIAPPVVVTVNPAQMMPVSAPQTQAAPQQYSEPIAVSEDAERALLIHSVEPVYPQEGVAQKLHGAVVLQALVGRDGSVEDLKIVRGYFILGRAAIAAVKQWRFQPYSVNGHAASTQTVITVNFTAPPG